MLRKRIFIVCYVLLVATTGILARFSWSDNPLVVNVHSSVDNFVIGNENFPIESSSTLSIFLDSNELKKHNDIEKLARIARLTVVFPVPDIKNESYVFSGSSGLKMNLSRRLTQDTYVTVGTTTSEGISFYLPEILLESNAGKITSRKIELYSVLPQEKGNIFSIGTSTHVSSKEIVGQKYFKLKDLEGVKITEYSPTLNSKNFAHNDWIDSRVECNANLPLMDNSTTSLSYIDESTADLKSINGVSCISTIFPIDVRPDKLYKFSFEYQSIEGDRVDYYYNFHDGEKWDIVEQQITPRNREWNTVESYPNITLSNIKTSAIYLYAKSEKEGVIENAFRNISLQEYSRIGEAEINLDEKLYSNPGTFSQDILSNHELRLSYGGNKRNLLPVSVQNFSTSSWRIPQECQNLNTLFDENTTLNHTISPKLADLKSINGVSCISTIFPIDVRPDKLYKFSFEYQSIEGDRVDYYYNFHDGEKWDIVEQQITPRNREWNTVESYPNITLSNIKTSAIYLYAKSEKEGVIENAFRNPVFSEFQDSEIKNFFLFATTSMISDSSNVIIENINNTNKAFGKYSLKNTKNIFVTISTDQSSWKLKRILFPSNRVFIPDNPYTISNNSNGWVVPISEICVQRTCDNGNISLEIENSFAVLVRKIALTAFGVELATALFFIYWSVRHRRHESKY